MKTNGCIYVMEYAKLRKLGRSVTFVNGYPNYNEDYSALREEELEKKIIKLLEETK